jgi:hypothetical protein
MTRGAICLTVLLCLYFFQMWSQLLLKRDLLTNYSIQVFAVGVFGQIILIVRIIARSIWDDMPYRQLLGNDHKVKHKEE